MANSTRGPASAVVSDSMLRKSLMWLILIILLAILAMQMASIFTWEGLMWLLACMLPLAVVLALSPRLGARMTASSWLELAHSTGLTYAPGDRSLWGTQYPAVCGDYRGHPLSMTFAFEEIPGDISVTRAFPRILLEVKNSANIRFAIRPKGSFVQASRIDAVASGNEDFRRLFVLEGGPERYLNRVVQRIVAADSAMLDCLRRNVSSIELSGSSLTCSQAGALAIEDQIALFTLLVDLADLAEKMGSESASFDGRSS